MPRVEVMKSGSMVYFKALSEHPITTDWAMESQRAHGFPVQGYGFYNFCLSIEKGLHVAKWWCSSTAD
jgi:hypothetical protein